MRNPAIISVCAMALAGCAHAPIQAPASEPPIDAAQLSLIAEESLERNKTPAVAVALIRAGKVLFSDAYGERAPGVPATRDILFNVASLTKPVAAETILRLINDGAFGLDEPMSPSFVDSDIAGDPRAAMLTPRLALSHQTGFPNWRDGKLGFQFDPGKGVGYSGEGYQYVARFAEEKTGERFPDLVRRLVLMPVGASGATLIETPTARSRAAHPKSADGEWKDPDLWTDWRAADNLFVSIDDYAAFVSAVARGDGLSPELNSERLRIQAAQDLCGGAIDPSCPNPAGFTLGWQRLEFGGKVFLLHTGEDWDARAMAYFNPETRDGAVAMASSAEGMKTMIDLLSTLDPDNPIVVAFKAALRTGN